MAVSTALIVPGAGAQGTPPTKVDRWVTDRIEAAGEAEFLVVLDEQADLSGAASLQTKEEKGRYVFQRLREVAEGTQPTLIDQIQAQGLDYRRFWIANMVWVRGDAAAAASLAARPDVRKLAANPKVTFRQPFPALPKSVSAAVPEPNLEQIGAPDLWRIRIDGSGVVIGNADTGIRWDHPALINQYRGWDGTSAIHDYNWHDAIHEGDGYCGADAAAPCDDWGHGTHTMGISVGYDGGQNLIGVAPGARWIGCRNMDRGIGSPASYAECYQFFVAPTDSSGENPMPELAPDVINGSWVCPPSEGCEDPNVLLTVFDNVRAAGILVVQAAGNTGPDCGSVEDPGAIYDSAFSVGMVDTIDEIVGASSRGPVTVDGSNRLKPDVTAPGWMIRSCIPALDGYVEWSGTSMAAPHVAGLAALLISAQECLRGDPDGLERHIRNTALPRPTTESCGGIDPGPVPNNTYGYGSVRAVRPLPSACSNIFDDGFESGSTSVWSTTLP